MSAKHPTELHELFAKYYNAGDIEGLVSLYEDNAMLVSAPGSIAIGAQAIRDALTTLTAMKGTIRFVGDGVLFEADDLALTHGRWEMSIDGMDDVVASTAEVARLQPDATWKYVIDNPWGAQIIAE